MDSEMYYVKHYAADWQRAVNGHDERFASLHPQFVRLMKCECLQSHSQWLLPSVFASLIVHSLEEIALLSSKPNASTVALKNRLLCILFTS